MGTTGAGFINSVAIRYMPIAGQKPVTKRKMMAMTLAQRIEKSKWSAIPRHTPKITPLRERYIPLRVNLS